MDRASGPKTIPHESLTKSCFGFTEPDLARFSRLTELAGFGTAARSIAAEAAPTWTAPHHTQVSVSETAGNPLISPFNSPASLAKYIPVNDPVVTTSPLGNTCPWPV